MIGAHDYPSMLTNGKEHLPDPIDPTKCLYYIIYIFHSSGEHVICFAESEGHFIRELAIVHAIVTIHMHMAEASSRVNTGH